MGLHPAERVREYRDKGYWTDDMIDALLRERVAQSGDITAITDPLNREALLDGPFRTLTWPQLDEQVSRLAQVLLAEGAGPGDVVVIAGKGHEQGQEFEGGRKEPFDDVTVARDALRAVLGARR